MSRRFTAVLLLVVTLLVGMVFALATIAQSIFDGPRAASTHIFVTLPAPLYHIEDPAVEFRFESTHPDQNGDAPGYGFNYILKVKEVGGPFKYKAKINPETCTHFCAHIPPANKWTLKTNKTFTWNVVAKGKNVGKLASTGKQYFVTSLLPEITLITSDDLRIVGAHNPIGMAVVWKRGPYDKMQAVIKDSKGKAIYNSGMVDSATLCDMDNTCTSEIITMSVAPGAAEAFSWKITGKRNRVAGKGKSDTRMFYLVGGS